MEKKIIILALVGRLYSVLQQESGLPQEGREIRFNSKYREDSGKLESMSGGRGSVDEKLLRRDIKVRDSC